MTNNNKPVVLVFRKRILPYSETFIVEQSLDLSHFHPCFIGFQYDESGEYLLNQSDRLILEDFSHSLTWSKIMHRLGLGQGINKYWINAIRKHQPSILHAHFANDAIDAMELAKQLNIPLLVTVHGHDITKCNESLRYNLMRKQLFKRADGILAVSEYIRKKLITKGCPEDKIIQHYIGLDLEKFAGNKNESEQPSLLFVGRLVQKKGCTYLLQAMKLLMPKYPGIHLTIVGTGPQEGSLRKQVADDKLNVEFVGMKTPEEIKQLMLQSWLFCVPSITADNGDAEGLGMVFLEAQALKTPVVSFASGGVIEAVDNGNTGLLCEEKDVDGLVDNISRLLEDEQKRLELGINGRQWVESRFDIRKQCVKLEEIYTSMMG